MTDWLQDRLRRWLERTETAWVILGASLLLTGVAWYLSDQAVRTKAEQRFAFQSEDLSSALRKRLLEYETVLRGGAGLFNASERITRSEWQQYVSDLRIQQNFPGIQGMGFSLMMPGSAVDQHVAEIRAEGFPDYEVRPAGHRDPRSAIVFLEPFDWRNQRAFGYDMFSETTRRAAMTLAMDSGEPALSGRVKLVQETERDTQYGFLMYVPVYKRGVPVESVAQRRSAIQGFVYAPFRAQDFMSGILGAGQSEMELELYDGLNPAEDNLLYDTAPHQVPHSADEVAHHGFSRQFQIDFGHRVWSLYVRSSDGYLSSHEEIFPMLVASGGVTVDFLLFVIVGAVSRKKRQAESESAALAAELSKTEARYQTLFRGARSPMLLIAPETGAIVDANPAALTFYGYDESTLRAMHISDINTLSAEEVAREMANCKAERRSHFNFSHRLANGELRAVEVRSGPLELDGQTLLYSIIHDVTDRKRIEGEIRERDTRLQNIIRGTRAGTWEWNIESGVVEINERWAEILGFTLNELAPVTADVLDALVHPDELASIHEVLRAHFAGAVPYYECQLRMRHKDGRWVWVLSRGQVISRDERTGAPIVMAGTHQDITDLKQNELNLEEARQAAEAANLAKSRFLATMSHEIRTPMNGILGMAQLLMMPDVSDDSRQEHVRTIYRSGQSMLALLNDILDLSKVEAGKIELESVRFSPAELLQRQATIFDEVCKRKGLTIEIDLDGAGLDGYFLGDPTRLGQVLGNLIGNAVKFSTQGVVRLRARKLHDDNQKTWVQFSVRDNGMGIASDQLARLFKPFSQVDGSITRRFGGSGLGLAIAKSLVELMGGRVGVDSRLGVGSTFWVEVPLAFAEGMTACQVDVTEAMIAEPPSMSGSGHGERILLVEDVPTNRVIIETYLQRRGYAITAVSDGQQALDWVKANPPPTMVLMDCQMPVMDGLEATRRIREWESRKGETPGRMPIVALTAAVFEDDRHLCLDAGMDDFLPKPVSFVSIDLLLAKWLPRAAESWRLLATSDLWGMQAGRSLFPDRPRKRPCTYPPAFDRPMSQNCTR